jgi:4-amino-4-deoxy-L-arabinose transferase-like glycosyltransferase
VFAVFWLTAFRRIRTMHRADRWAMVAGPLIVAVLVVWLAGFTGSRLTGALADTTWVLLTSAPWALGWLVSAFGFGWPVRRWLLPVSPDGPILQGGLGIATLLALDAALGALGVLQWCGSVAAWALMLVGVGLAVTQRLRSDRVRVVCPWLIWASAPGLAVLLLAACSAPGWLWSSEFGGYDALSYHLQLPAEWLTLGRIEPLAHNVYSFLPGYVEAAYYHLVVLIGDSLGAVYACQLLHAGFTLLTAVVVWRLGLHLGGRLVAAASAVVVLGTPWVIVVGSLGYNEMAVTLLLATGLLVVAQEDLEPWRAGAAVGVLSAAACGAKLTAVGFVAAPLGLLLLLNVPPKRWGRVIAAGGCAAVVFLLPYLLRNWAHVGNPVFPFAAGGLGLGHWTAEQAQTWASGHRPDTGLGGRLGEAWNQVARYGLGPNPQPGEPWLPQWSLLPWLAVAGLAAGWFTPRLRRWSWQLGLVLAVAVLFWILATHVKSRFMVPAVVPGALAVGIGLAAGRDRMRSDVGRTIVTIVLAATLLAWCSLPLVHFLGEGNGAPAAMIGWADILTGDRVKADERAEFAETIPAVYLNHVLGPNSKTLLVGEATPLYYRGDISYQTTWDRGPMSEAMRAHPDDPEGWVRYLVERGYTHLLVNAEMLELWQVERWNDPLLTSQRVLDAADRYATLEREFPAGLRLYRLA